MSRLIITIGRQYGSGGKEIGKKLAKRLAIPFYGKEELMKLAKEKPGYEEVSCFYEEQPINSLLYAIAMNQEEECRGKRAFERIRKLCEDQSCVLVGRCGNYVFKEDEDCIRIFLYAQKPAKIELVSKRDGISRAKAETRIERIEQERADFHKYYTGETWGKAEDYDLCIDTGVLGVDQTVELILDYLNRKKQK